MATGTLRVTAEELLRMPDDGSRYELVEGELRKMPPAGKWASGTPKWLGFEASLKTNAPKLA